MRTPAGFIEFDAAETNGARAPIYANADKSPEHARLELQAKVLHTIIQDAHPDKNVGAPRSKGIITVETAPIKAGHFGKRAPIPLVHKTPMRDRLCERGGSGPHRARVWHGLGAVVGLASA